MPASWTNAAPKRRGSRQRSTRRGAEFAWIPRQIVSAWYLGVVGVIDSPADAEAGLVPPEAVEEGTPAAMQTVAWEQALMFAPLAGTIPIPSYVYRGNWAEKPESGG